MRVKQSNQIRSGDFYIVNRIQTLRAIALPDCYGRKPHQQECGAICGRRRPRRPRPSCGTSFGFLVTNHWLAPAFTSYSVTGRWSKAVASFHRLTCMGGGRYKIMVICMSFTHKSLCCISSPYTSPCILGSAPYSFVVVRILSSLPT